MRFRNLRMSTVSVKIWWIFLATRKRKQIAWIQSLQSFVWKSLFQSHQSALMIPVKLKFLHSGSCTRPRTNHQSKYSKNRNNNYDCQGSPFICSKAIQRNLTLICIIQVIVNVLFVIGTSWFAHFFILTEHSNLQRPLIILKKKIKNFIYQDQYLSNVATAIGLPQISFSAIFLASSNFKKNSNSTKDLRQK